MNLAQRWRGIVVATATLLVAVTAIFGGSFAPDKEQPTQVVQESPASAAPAIPKNVSTILSLKAVRSITGVSKLAWSGSDGVMERTGEYLENGTRYSTSIYAHPDRSDKYVDIRIYKGRSKFVTLRDTMFDLSTEDDAWDMIDPRILARPSDVPQAFMAARYAKNGSKISTLCFIFDQFTIKVEIDNLSDKILVDLGKEVVAGMYALNTASV